MVMFRKWGWDGLFVFVLKIDIRVGCVFDGVVVYYKDGSSVLCGLVCGDGFCYGMGGY